MKKKKAIRSETIPIRFTAIERRQVEAEAVKNHDCPSTLLRRMVLTQMDSKNTKVKER